MHTASILLFHILVQITSHGHNFTQKETSYSSMMTVSLDEFAALKIFKNSFEFEVYLSFKEKMRCN